MYLSNLLSFWRISYLNPYFKAMPWFTTTGLAFTPTWMEFPTPSTSGGEANDDVSRVAGAYY